MAVTTRLFMGFVVILQLHLLIAFVRQICSRRRPKNKNYLSHAYFEKIAIIQLSPFFFSVRFFFLSSDVPNRSGFGTRFPFAWIQIWLTTRLFMGFVVVMQMHQLVTFVRQICNRRRPKTKHYLSHAYFEKIAII